MRAGWGPLRGRAARRSHFSTPGAKATDFSRFGAHLLPEHFSRFDPKVPHFSNQLTSSPGRVSERTPRAADGTIQCIPAATRWLALETPVSYLHKIRFIVSYL